MNIAEKNLCTGCGGCAAVCSRNAITMKSDQEGFLYPVVNYTLCNQCGLCSRICHLNSSTPTEHPAGESLCFGARAKEEDIRLLGSSGGIFPLMARAVLQNGGIVFGASLLPDGKVCHIEIDKTEDIPKLSKTKYVQSDLSEMWKQIAPLLRAGRRVLFCGTPCQAAALRTYLGKEQGKLITVDLICYGVPSPGIWKKYVHFLEKKYRGKFQTFSFRDKRNRDNGHSCMFRVDGREYVRSLYQDRFCRTFLSDINIRPSCFHCRYCTTERDSDITLGDFWGIEQVKPGFDDGMGCSAVICRTLAGKALWREIENETDWFACRREDIANDRQPRLREPTKPSPKRESCMKLYRWLPFPLWLRLFKK